jgi:hypothetical protein
VLAAVARACVDVADGEASCTIRRRQRELAAQATEIFEQRQHQRSAQA